MRKKLKQPLKLPPKGLPGIVATNVNRLFDACGQSQDTLARRGHTSAKNLNNARNGVNISLNTLKGVAKTFGYHAWELLIPGMDVSKARLEGAELVEAFGKAPLNIQHGVQFALGLRKILPDSDSGQEKDA